MPKNQNTEYIKYISAAIAPMLPENPALARGVLAILSRGIGLRIHLMPMALAAVMMAGVMLALDADPAEAEAGLHARIVRAVDERDYLVIYDRAPGKPERVVYRAFISPQDAAERLRTPGWQAVALAAFRRT
jgi:hypothetical protein